MSNKDESSALDDLFWREEILQVLFWLQGERLSEGAGAQDLAIFLAGDARTIAHHLEKLANGGYLLQDSGSGRYALTALGRENGSRLFAGAFEGMQMQGHGECNLDCSCLLEGPESCPAHHHQ